MNKLKLQWEMRYLTLKYFPHKIIINYKEEKGDFMLRSLSDTT